MGGPTMLGFTVKLNSEASTPRLPASASMSPVCALITSCAACELAEPWLTTVTAASTLSSVLVVAMLVSPGSPR